MNGAPGRTDVGLSSRRATLNAASRRRLSAAFASASLLGRNALSPSWETLKRQGASSPSRARSTNASQNSSGVKARISRSRSTMSRTATDCTRPADNPRATFDHNKGDSSKPTTRSRKRRACWAFTRASSMPPGLRNASWIASCVISLNTTRRNRSGSPPITCCRCQAMASPSRSKSVARYTRSARAAERLSSATTFSLPGSTWYSAAQPLSGSTPMRLTSCWRARRRW